MTVMLGNEFEEHQEKVPVVIASDHLTKYLDYVHGLSLDETNEPPYQPAMMEEIKDELYRIAEDYQASPSINRQLDSYPWEHYDVMVGTVRSKEQLLYTLQENAYYVPARLVPEKKDNFLEYVALHEEDIDGQACIRYFGKVDSLAQVERASISVPMSRNNGEELYLMIGVKEWLTLPTPIPIRDSYKGRPRYTNLFLLQHCNRSYQLFCIRSAEDYRTCAAVIRAYNHRYESSNLHIIGGRYISRTEGEEFVVMNAYGREVERFAISLYETHPASVILRLHTLMA